MIKSKGSTNSFWERNQLAMNINSSFDNEKSVAESERDIAEYFDDLRARIPKFFLVSDSVATDIARLDGILQRNQSPIICQRGNLYLSTASIWSYSLAIAHSLNIRARDIPKHRLYKRARSQHKIRAID